METRYQNGRIYKIVCADTGSIYVGSTCQRLSKRLSWHKNDRTLGSGASVHFSKVGWDKATILLVENYPCDGIEQLRAREEHWRVALGADLNRRRASAQLPEGTPRSCEDMEAYSRAYRTKFKEKINDYAERYRAANREKARAYAERYRAANREKVQLYTQRYRAANRENINTMTRTSKQVYRTANKESIAQKSKVYYATHKDTINAKKRQVALCPHCSKEMSKGGMSRHIRNIHGK